MLAKIDAGLQESSPLRETLQKARPPVPMQLTVRDTTPDDLDSIFQIRYDPLVRPHQYRVSVTGTADEWRDRLSGKTDTGFFALRSSTILDGDTIIGHVMHARTATNGAPSVQCGWDLVPGYWGRGVMCGALAQLFDCFFAHHGITHVYADCFRSNRRCMRLLEKLGFAPSRIPAHHRAMIAYSTRCLRWIKRYRLAAEDWPAARENLRNLPATAIAVTCG